MKQTDLILSGAAALIVLGAAMPAMLSAQPAPYGACSPWPQCAAEAPPPPDFGPLPPPRPAPVPDQHSAVVMNDSNGFTWATHRRSGNSAERDALDECRRAGGSNCRSIARIKNSCVAVAWNRSSQIFTGIDPFDTRSAMNALASCKRSTADRSCTMVLAPVCASARYRQTYNDYHARLGPDVMPKFTAQIEGLLASGR